ncbi:MAG: hypothetical protein BGN96_04835 [Bacteroidales bacterium 45-6]|nr:MAG: hypothetical protein BGN96_04835 [Bacteroidales bacterium 45-6]
MFSCGLQSKKEEQGNSSTPPIQVVVKKTKPKQNINLQIEESATIGDTLQIVSTQKMLYFPFGIHSGIKDYLKELPLKISLKEKVRENMPVYFIEYNKSIIEVLLGEDPFGKNELLVNIVKAEIMDNQINLFNNIQVGVSKQFFSDFFNLNKTLRSNQIRVVEFVSALSGIWYYYTFDENDILKKIEIKSDYVFE